MQNYFILAFSLPIHHNLRPLVSAVSSQIYFAKKFKLYRGSQKDGVF